MKILLATDGSEYSERAAKFLTCLNLSSNDEVTIFHALYWIPFLYDKESYYDTLKEIKMDIAPKIIDSALNILKPVHARISTAIVEGSPEECIVDVANNSDIDMVVMGARGIKGLKSFFIGSATSSVTVRSLKPVLVVKLPVRERLDKINILFATDGSDHAADTGKFLSEIPFPDNTEIIILNVISTPFSLNIPESFYPRMNERLMEMETRAREREFANSERVIENAREQLTKSFQKVEVLSEVGDPTTEILRVSDRSGSDIIAVGCRGLRGLKGIMGSISRNVLTHSKCSVLIGKMCGD